MDRYLTTNQPMPKNNMLNGNIIGAIEENTMLMIMTSNAPLYVRGYPYAGGNGFSASRRLRFPRFINRILACWPSKALTDSSSMGYREKAKSMT